MRKATPRLPGSSGRPREVTLAASDRVAETGIRLGDEQQRQALAQRIRKVPPARRRELTRDLRATIENLGKLLEEIDEDGKNDE